MSPEEAAKKLNPTSLIMTDVSWKCFAEVVPHALLYIFVRPAETAPAHKFLRPKLAQQLGIDPNDLFGGYVRVVRETQLRFDGGPADSSEPSMTKEQFDAAAATGVVFFE